MIQYQRDVRCVCNTHVLVVDVLFDGRSFGTAESIEGAWFLKTGDLIPISEQAFMDCSWGYGDNGCDGLNPLLSIHLPPTTSHLFAVKCSRW